MYWALVRVCCAPPPERPLLTDRNCSSFCIIPSFPSCSSLLRCWLDMEFNCRLSAGEVCGVQHHLSASSQRCANSSSLLLRPRAAPSARLGFLKYLFSLALTFGLDFPLILLLFFQSMALTWIQECAGLWIIFSLMVSLRQQFRDGTSERSGSISERSSNRGTELDSTPEGKSHPHEPDVTI